MKLTGLTGTGVGKLGNTVFSVNAGVQIVREYNPNISNPSTVAQVNQRARMKLLAQLACAVSSAIAIPKQGLVSARNQFISANFPFTSSVNGTASVEMDALQLTKGTLPLPALVVVRNESDQIEASLLNSVSQFVDRVIYIAYARMADGTLMLLDSKVALVPGDNGTFPVTMENSNGQVFVYAYGMVDADAAASAKYANYHVESGEDIAYLIARRTMSESDYIFTKTVGYMLAADTNAAFSSISVGGVNIAASGQTSVPYANTVPVNITTTDADGLYVYADAGIGTPMVRPLSNGSASFTIGNLGGQEHIVFMLGEYDGVNFTPLKQYGGVAAIAAQGATFTSVTLGGVAIGASGNTQVGVAESLELVVNCTNIQALQCRVAVNQQIVDRIGFIQGVATTTLTNLQIGDVVQIDCGHNVNDNFLVAATFGGHAVIAENPPVFNSLSVGGNAIASTGTTDVVAANNLSVVASASNANGKYLLKKVGSGSFASTGVVFSSNSATTTLNLAIGDNVQFAIGTVDGGTVSVEATFGGTIAGVDQVVEGISSVSMNNTPITANRDLYSDPSPVTIDIQTANYDTTNKYAGIYSNDNAPTVGSTVAASNKTAFDASGAAQIDNYYVPSNIKVWFIAGTQSGNNLVVDSVFPYYVKFYSQE